MVEEVMDLDYSNSLFIEMNSPRQSMWIAWVLLGLFWEGPRFGSLKQGNGSEGAQREDEQELNDLDNSIWRRSLL